MSVNETDALNTDKNGEGATGEEAELSWDNMKDELETNFADFKDNINKWKTKAMDQFLLNEDVYLYDFVNRESKAGKGPFRCRIFDNKPCCIPNEIWEQTTPSRPSQMQKIINAFTGTLGKNRVKTACYNHFGLQHEYDASKGLENQCWHEDDNGVECEEQFQDWCLYDKNGAACCTKKLDLVHGWLDKGYLERSPFDNYIKLFDKSDGQEKDYWNLIQKFKWTVPAATIYHVDGTDKEHKFLDLKTRWNFECPTHHPVPAVAIILGCFIPVMFILLLIVIIQCFRGRSAQPKEEEAAVDEIPAAGTNL